MAVPLTDVRAQYSSIKASVDAAVARVVSSGQFILGAEVEAFEEDACSYLGTKYAVGVASGTDALHLALLAAGIGPGDEVITTAFTFVATAESVVRCGAKPVFVDIDPRTYNMDSKRIESKITSRVRAILPVHLFGQPTDMKAILDIARRKGLAVIEDCAQAFGAECLGAKVGSLGLAGCFSFFPSKNLGAFGDGGLVATNDAAVADKVRLLRGHGAQASYYHTDHGFNSRLDAIQAAVLRVKLPHIEEWNAQRRRNFKLYDTLLSSQEGIETPYIAGNLVSSCNYYTIRLTDDRLDRKQMQNHLQSTGIQTNVYYPLSLHLQPVYEYLEQPRGSLPNCEEAQEQVLSLPMYPELSEEQIREVAAAIKRFIQR